MDVKVYEKEEVKQPDGRPSENYYVPNITDLIPVLKEGSEEGVIDTFAVLDDTAEQECSLATLWQRGLDPIDPSYGIHWTEALLGEIDAIQIIGEINEAVANTVLGAQVEFSTKNVDGKDIMTYTIKVA